MRFMVKLRVQNPNDEPIEYNGIALDLDVNGQPLASGVSDQTGEVPRFGERVVSVPLTVSAFSAFRQAWGLSNNAPTRGMPYVVKGSSPEACSAPCASAKRAPSTSPGRPSARRRPRGSEAVRQGSEKPYIICGFRPLLKRECREHAAALSPMQLRIHLRGWCAAGLPGVRP